MIGVNDGETIQSLKGAAFVTQSTRRCYEPVRLLGRGSFGTVLLARIIDSCGEDAASSLRVVKQVELHGADERQRAEALRETEVLRSLSHPNIIGYFEAFLEGATLCIAMEYADGGDLAAAVERRRGAGQKYQERDAMAVLAQLVLAMHYLHERLILHRDLKSQNVFLTSTGAVKLGDFGIAKVLRASLQCAETQVGTPYYLPPEIIENKAYDYKADVWGLGVVFYEVLALEVPFSAHNIAALALRICASEPRPVPAMYGAETRALLNRMLAKRPEDRPSIADIAALPHVCRAAAALAVGTCLVGSGNGYGAGTAGGEVSPQPSPYAPAEPTTPCVARKLVGVGTSCVGIQHSIAPLPVDLAEAEDLLVESPHSVKKKPKPDKVSAVQTSCSFDLAELEQLLRRPIEEFCGGSPETEPMLVLSARGPIVRTTSSRTMAESTITCSNMLRNLEKDFGLV